MLISANSFLVIAVKPFCVSVFFSILGHLINIIPGWMLSYAKFNLWSIIVPDFNNFLVIIKAVVCIPFECRNWLARKIGTTIIFRTNRFDLNIWFIIPICELLFQHKIKCVKFYQNNAEKYYWCYHKSALEKS